MTSTLQHTRATATSTLHPPATRGTTSVPPGQSRRAPEADRRVRTVGSPRRRTRTDRRGRERHHRTAETHSRTSDWAYQFYRTQRPNSLDVCDVAAADRRSHMRPTAHSYGFVSVVTADRPGRVRRSARSDAPRAVGRSPTTAWRDAPRAVGRSDSAKLLRRRISFV